jgi:tetratricopeptide (TPR) repeat protein
LNGANRIDDSIEAATQALSLFEVNNHRGGQSQALSLLGELWQRKNEPDKAVALLERAIGFERESGRRRELGITLGNLSRVALDLGEWAKVRVCCEEAVEIHREVGNKYNEGMQLMGLGDAAIGENELAEADQCYFDALVPLRAINSHVGISAAHLRRGIVAQLSSKREVAIKYYRQAIGDAAQSHDVEMPGWVEMWIALLAAQAGDQKAANAALNRAYAAMPATSVQGCETLAMTVAVVARLLGETSNILPEPQSWDSRIIRRLAQ